MTERTETDIRRSIIRDAEDLIETPYLWGGRSQWGIDCSGFVQLVYRLSGLLMPRDASEQAKLGNTMSFISEAQPGDLAFFDNEEGNIVHVGIVYSPNEIIHASKKVRIDRIDHNGIYNDELKKYTHQLRVMKNVIG
jgi:cell wall-associated NlpC family hydrolase